MLNKEASRSQEAPSPPRPCSVSAATAPGPTALRLTSFLQELGLGGPQQPVWSRTPV